MANDINEKHRAVVNGLVKGVIKSAKNRFGEEKTKQAFMAVKDLVKAVSPGSAEEVQIVNSEELKELEDLSHESEIASLQELAGLTDDEKG